jgi:enamine deaminase RidA (YjgF/YER057c/UK114 family)
MSRVERLVVEGLGRLQHFSHAGVAGDVIHVSGTIGAEPGSTDELW